MVSGFSRRSFKYVLFLVFGFVIFMFSSSNVSATIYNNYGVYVNGGVYIDYAYVDTVTIRPENHEYLIDDDGVLDQNSDVVNLSTIWDINCQELRRLGGYNTLVLIFHLEICEFKDGYQEIYLYSGANQLVDVSPITTFEHGSGYTETSWEEYEFYAEIPLNNIVSNQITIRYGAHGFGADDWKNRELVAQIGIATEQQNYNQLLNVENWQ